jgi:inner membrane protein
MLFRTHALFGVFVWLLLALFIEMPLFVLGFALFGAAFVDVDSCRSRIGKRLWFLSWIFKHRGVIHSLLACLILSLIVGIFSLWASFGFFVGYVSHLALDALTPRGVALFWPLKFRVRGFIRSGSWVEDVIFVLLLFLNIVLGYLFLMT